MDDLETTLENARRRTLDWLATLRVDRVGAGVHRFSSAHCDDEWPGMMLPATYNAALLRVLLDDPTLDADHAASDWLLTRCRTDGVFEVAGMHQADTWKKPSREETRRYIDFHVTNYALGAVLELDPSHQPQLGFIGALRDPAAIDRWLGARDWADPWQEGNNVVNLASFLTLAAERGDPAAAAALARLIERLETLQEPSSGFWQTGPSDEPMVLLHAFAGAMHSYHLWYAAGRNLPHHRLAIDYVLERPTLASSACLDVDEVDVLYHGYRLLDHRRPEIERWMGAKLVALLALQREDGGFADEARGTLRLDGWVGGYAEPQGASNAFASWFRWIAIAMIGATLHPHGRRWRFRRTLGIGYALTDGASR